MIIQAKYLIPIDHNKLLTYDMLYLACILPWQSCIGFESFALYVFMGPSVTGEMNYGQSEDIIKSDRTK
jgi:hypothetical protein